jgi:predicted ArsR family transcriptional regulator
LSRIQQVIDTLEAERKEVREHLDWLDGQIAAFRDRHSPTPHAGAGRSQRRATARRASSRRARTRSRRSDTTAQITAYLGAHPGSTAGDIAKGLNLKRNSISTRLTQMAKAGDIKKADRGYKSK